MTDLANFLSGTVLSILQLCCFFYISFCWAFKFHKVPNHIKLPIAITSSLWLAAIVFISLISLGFFNRLATSLVLFSAAAITAQYARKEVFFISELKELAKATSDWWKQADLSIKCFSIATGAVLLVRVARGLITPPLAWDALTYHLLKAGRWVQSGKWVGENAPDAWQFYEFFPPLGDVYWAWAMLGTHSDAWLIIASLLIHLAAGACTFALAKVLDASNDMSVLALLCTISTPAAVGLLGSYYVDTLTMTAVTAGAALLLYAVPRKDLVSCSIGLVACAIGAGVKITVLPYFVVASLGWFYVVLKSRNLGIVLATLAAVMVALFWQVYLAFIGHTPFYPNSFSFVGFQIEAGNPQLQAYLYPPLKYDFPYWYEVTRALAKFLFFEDEQLTDHLNLTWYFPILAAYGLYESFKRTPLLSVNRQLLLWGFIISGATILATFWAPGGEHYRRYWVVNMGRFFLPFYVTMIAVSAASKHKGSQTVLLVAVLVNLLMAVPRGWLPLDANALGTGVAIIGLIVLILLLATHSTGYKKFILFALMLLPIALVYERRSHYRPTFYDHTAWVFDGWPLGNYFVPGSAVAYLDSKSKQTINFTGGYGGLGYRWFRYLFLGSRLQNNVVYVTPTGNGEVVNGSTDIVDDTQMSYEAWVSRLMAQQVDYIYCVKPFPLELDWMKTHPEEFQLTHVGKFRDWYMYRMIK